MNEEKESRFKMWAWNFCVCRSTTDGSTNQKKLYKTPIFIIIKIKKNKRADEEEEEDDDRLTIEKVFFLFLKK